MPWSALFPKTPHEIESHEETCKGHGRTETRRIERMPAGDVAWPWLRQWCRITRTRINNRTKEQSTEVAYIISSLPVSMTTPQQMLELNRNHWGVENRLHWVKDTILREDASTIRTRNAPQAIAALRNTALRLLQNIHPSTIVARETCTRKPRIALYQLLNYSIK